MGTQRFHKLVAASVIAFVASTAARAELTPEQTTTAQECVKQFSAREFDVRQKAVEKLVRLGPNVVPLIKKKLAESQDNEVTLRCNMVLRGIRRYYIVDADDKLLNVGPSTITIDVKQTPLETVMKRFGELSGNVPLTIKTAATRKKPVTLQLKDVPYWQAVDELRKAAGLVYAYDYTTRGMALYAGRPGDEIGAYPGPAMVKLNTISRWLHVLRGNRRKGLTFSFL